MKDMSYKTEQSINMFDLEEMIQYDNDNFIIGMG